MKRNLNRKIFNVIESRNLCSYMNYTKWCELRNAMTNDMPFPPPYIMKTLFENECKYEKEFEKDVYYLGD